MNSNQTKLHNQLSQGLIVIQKNNTLNINGENINSKTVMSYCVKQGGNSNYRTLLKSIITIQN